MNKLKVGILMGGMSAENEVSFNSGRTVYDNLDKSLYQVIPIFQKNSGELFILPQKFIYRGKIADFENRLESEAQRIYWSDLPNLIDFAYIAMHGRYAEDGTLQGMLAMLQIPYLGTKVFASAFTRDKFLAYNFMQHIGINVPNFIEVAKSQIEHLDQNFEKLLNQIKNQRLNFPLIVKPHLEGSSIGVCVACSEDELKAAILKSAYASGQAQSVLVEEKLNGKEFTSIAITDSQTGELIPLPPTEIEIESGTAIFDYEQKYMPGRATKHTPARFTQEILNKISETTVKIMCNFDIKTFVRIDGFIVDDSKIVIIDINTISGMAPASFLFRQAAEIGMSHSTLINSLIKVELINYRVNLGRS